MVAFCLSNIQHAIYFTVCAQDQIGLVPGNISGGYINGRIVCRFERLIRVDSSGARRKRQTMDDVIKVFPLDTSTYFILMAQGPASGGLCIRIKDSDEHLMLEHRITLYMRLLSAAYPSTLSAEASFNGLIEQNNQNDAKLFISLLPM